MYDLCVSLPGYAWGNIEIHEEQLLMGDPMRVTALMIAMSVAIVAALCLGIGTFRTWYPNAWLVVGAALSPSVLVIVAVSELYGYAVMLPATASYAGTYLMYCAGAVARLQYIMANRAHARNTSATITDQ
jgi:hypothetical protein